jgi:hypothetical protein
MKRIFLCSIFVLFSCSLKAQSSPEPAGFIPGGIRQFQFALPKQGAEIKELQYVPSGEPVKGSLSPDGNRVVLDNYRKGSRIKLQVLYSDGTSEEVQKSPCFIDPVTYEL